MNTVSVNRLESIKRMNESVIAETVKKIRLEENTTGVSWERGYAEGLKQANRDIKAILLSCKGIDYMPV
jgi:enolase